MQFLWKKECFENINVKDIYDDKKLCATIKPFSSSKSLSTNKIMLIEKNNLISEESAVANNTINQCFTKYVLLSKQVESKKISPIKEFRRHH